MHLCIIGISDESTPIFSSEVKERLVGDGVRFAGGERHRELVEAQLPANASWTNITVPLAPFLQELRERDGVWVVFASGDPLFFGIGNTLRREFPDAPIEVFPTFNSLQLLAHRLLLPYGTASVVTLTGRPWQALDKALIDNQKLIAVLTDKVKTPRTIAQRMLDFGYSSYTMLLGEKLGGADERVRALSLEEALTANFAHPNCLYLQQNATRLIRQGIPDAEFQTLEGRPRMMTKMAVRLASLAAMDIRNHSVLWDVGACTGSISIEAKLMNPLLDVHSFEVREESAAIVAANARKFGAPLTYHGGDFGVADISAISKPDAVFLGGYGGKMELLLNKIDAALADGGVIGFNAVSDTSLRQFVGWAAANGYQQQSSSTIKVDEHNAIMVVVVSKKVYGR
jgi:precorrin-6B C5,15-methyltransferase / cobalt-precorrin-6B C5,C15-methyltransferase